MPSSEERHGRAARPRIAYLVKRFPRLSETFVLNECLALEREGVDIDIFSLLTPPDEPRHDLLTKLNAKVTYLDDVNTSLEEAAHTVPKFDVLFTGKSEVSRAKLVAKARRIARLAAASGCDHLHAHFGSDTTTVAALVAEEMGIGYSFTAHAKDIYHTYLDPVLDAKVRSAKIHHAAFVVTVSEYNRAHLAHIARTEDRSKIIRLYNGVDLSRFAFVGAGEREPATILAVGRLVEKKGYADLISAMTLVRAQRPDARCVICGEGNLRSEIEAQISEAGLGSEVTLFGALEQAEIIRQMRTATVLVLPAIVTESGDRDALPTVLLEAQATGLPVISTPVCGIPEIISDGETGCLVPERSPAALADSIVRLLGDEALRTHLARTARVSAERLFDVSVSASTLSGLFRGTIEAQTRASPMPENMTVSTNERSALISGM